MCHSHGNVNELPYLTTILGSGPRRIAVGMSGGVDSTVTAALLRDAGHEVVGLTMLIWDDSIAATITKKRGGCFGPDEEEELARARHMADVIGIPHHAVRLTDAYRAEVLDWYRHEFLAGRTPNPCALCNPRMKFDLLPRQARDQGIGFDLFATGHYARIVKNAGSSCFHLFRGRDRDKDQSYFLARLSQKQLAECVLPLGEMTKAEVREKALSLGFDDVVKVAESQDFFAGDDHAVLFDPQDIKPGPIVDMDGRCIGTHRGIVHYTVGQRQGLGVAAGRKLYVNRICAETNTLVLADREDSMRNNCEVRGSSWISGQAPQAGVRCLVQLRYRHAGVMSKIKPLADGNLHVVFDEPQFAVAPGQMAVFYDGEDVMGGGWIV